MNEKEERFKSDTLLKLQKYSILNKSGSPVTFKECLKHAANKFVETTYNDGTKELIDVGIEKYLYQCSPYLYIDRNCFIELPGYGRMPASCLYYYQKMILKTYSPKISKFVFTKTRQCGMSTLSSLIFLWKAVCFPGQDEKIISKDGDSAVDVLNKIKDNLPEIPNWLGLKIVKNNEKSVKFSNKSIIKSYACSPTAGRGGSPTFVLLDESGFYRSANMAEGIVSSVSPSLAKTSGQLFVVSTPNGSAEGTAGYWYYTQVRDLKKVGGTEYNSDGSIQSLLVDISWWEVPDTEGIKPYKGYNKIVQEFIDKDYFNHPDIKKTAEDFFALIADKPQENDWLKLQMHLSGEVKYKQEILKNFTVTGNTIFSESVIKRMEERVLPPIKEGDLNEHYYKGLWFWKLPEVGHRYISSSDVAKGTANDESAMQIIDLDTNEQCAEYLGRCSTKDFAKIINDVGKYYNNAYVYVECNSIGEAVFNDLYYNYNYNNMYKMKKINKNDKTQVWTGWMTTQKSRELITDNFIATLTEDDRWNNVFFHSQRLVDQCKFWMWIGGRPDHPSGEHDDDILSMCIALYNMSKARTSTISDSKVPIMIKDDGTQVSVDSSEKAKYYDTHEVLDRDGYIQTEDNIRKSMNSPENYDEDPLDIYRWLLS